LQKLLETVVECIDPEFIGMRNRFGMEPAAQVRIL
jgi:hypothetical protein